MSNIEIEVKNAELLGRTDSIYATRFYVMQKQIDELQQENTKLINQQQEFIKYLEDEKERLARECSNIYEDSLGKTNFVNEDIFNEVDKNLTKYKEIIGVSDDK